MAALLAFWGATFAAASDSPGAASAAVTRVRVDDPETAPAPPAPGAPAKLLTRGPDGRATVHAVRLKQRLKIDGQLDDGAYTRVEPIVEFVQQEPREGTPTSERTEAWVFFDDDFVYVAGRMWDSEPERMVANEMRRDHINLWENENFGFVLDTFHDRRNAFFFYTNPLGGLFDGLITDEREVNRDWNTVWQARSARFDHGWTTEIAIPFKSLRYAGSASWGLNLRRRIRWKNEVVFLGPVPASFGERGIMQVSRAADLVGIEPPPGSANLEIKPYTIGGFRTDLDADEPFSDELDAAIGGDLKYGITRSLTLDLTVNTDFAQVEDDIQQVNLTRFGLFFPEKREFFLEGQGIFSFAAGRSGRRFRQSPAPILFFSRRIGLSEEGPVSIRGGARLTGKAGAWGVGALHLRTGEDPETLADRTDFTVLRLKRDFLRRSTFGGIYTRRGPSIDGFGSNETLGADVTLALLDQMVLTSYYAATRTPEATGDQSSHQIRLEYRGDKYGLEADRLGVGADFNPEIGFVPRHDMLRHYGEFRFTPRPRNWQAVRKVGLITSFEHIQNGAGLLETRTARASWLMEFENSGRLFLSYRNFFERLIEEFEVVDDVVIPTGEYDFSQLSLFFEMPAQKRLSGWVRAATGGYFDGKRTSASYEGRLELSPRLSVEPRLEMNWVDLPDQGFTAGLFGGRAVFSFSPRAVLSALIQFNSLDHAIDTNVRLRWEYRPGSEVFLVYGDGRDTTLSGFPGVRNQSIVVKLTRLVRF